MLAYIDDLHMPLTLNQSSSTALELLRDFMLNGGWHKTKGLSYRKVFDTFLFATATDYHWVALSKRLTHHFAIIGMDIPSKETVHSIFKVYCDLVVIKWGSDI